MEFHNRKSPRLKTWDYSTPWWYYITINTKRHVECFGSIINKQMRLNDLGKIVDEFWRKIPEHYQNVELDYYVIMPNHQHGIIILNPGVRTPYMASLPLGDVIGKFKAAVTRYAQINGYFDFSWQSRYYDRIIRNEKELYKIRKYILMNPLMWDLGGAESENLEV